MPRGRSRGGKSRAGSSKRRGPRQVNVTVDLGGAANYEEVGYAQGYQQFEEEVVQYNPYSGYGEIYEESFIPAEVYEEEIYYQPPPYMPPPPPPPRIVNQEVTNYKTIEYTQPVARAVEVLRKVEVPKIVEVYQDKFEPHYVENIVKVPKKEIRHNYVDVPQIKEKIIDKVVEIPEVRYVDKHVAGDVIYKDVYED